MRKEAIVKSKRERIIATLQDYPRMMYEIEANACNDVYVYENHIAVCNAIDRALDTVPEAMRKGIVGNIMKEKPFPKNNIPLREWQKVKKNFLIVVGMNCRIL